VFSQHFLLLKLLPIAKICKEFSLVELVEHQPLFLNDHRQFACSCRERLLLCWGCVLYSRVILIDISLRVFHHRDWQLFRPRCPFLRTIGHHWGCYTQDCHIDFHKQKTLYFGIQSLRPLECGAPTHRKGCGDLAGSYASCFDGSAMRS
jgi:hypothetical protein